MNTHEYANELICILEYQIKGKYLRIFGISTLPIYVEHMLRYNYVFYYVYCQNSICIMGCHGKGYILYSINKFFLQDIFFLI